jgi:hypothetical protein
MVPYPEKEMNFLEDEIKKLKERGEWCGQCNASDCDHLIAGGVHYEKLGVSDEAPAYPDYEIEPTHEMPEDTDDNEDLQYEDRHPTHTPRTINRPSIRPQRPPR